MNIFDSCGTGDGDAAGGALAVCSGAQHPQGLKTMPPSFGYAYNTCCKLKT